MRKSRKILILASLVLITFSQVFVWNFIECNGEREKIEDLKFARGDIISCRITGTWGLVGVRHFLLALNEEEIIHIVGGLTLAHLERKQFVQAFKDNLWDDCERVPAYGNGWPYYYNNEEAALRAEHDLQRYPANFYYDSKTCNCEHWVTWWKYGQPYSFQIAELLFWSGEADSDCPTQ